MMLFKQPIDMLKNFPRETTITTLNKSTVNTEQSDRMFNGIIMHPHNLYIRDDVVCIIDSGNVYPYISVEQFAGSITIETTQLTDFRGFKVESCIIVVDNNENV